MSVRIKDVVPDLEVETDTGRFSLYHDLETMGLK